VQPLARHRLACTIFIKQMNISAKHNFTAGGNQT